MKNFLLLVSLFFIFFILQTSFFIHFGSSNIFFHLILLSFFVLILIEPANNINSLILAASIGLFWDFFSSGSFGRYLIVVLLSSFFLKLFLKTYVRIPEFKRI